MDCTVMKMRDHGCIPGMKWKPCKVYREWLKKAPTERLREAYSPSS